jgi:hypothetical protein
MVDITEVSAIVAATGVLVGVIYYILDMRYQSKVRQTDLVMRLYATFSSNEFQDAWAKVRARGSDFEKLDDIFEFDKKGGLREVNQICLFFEGIGILLQRRLLDTRMIEDLFGGSVARAWETCRIGVMKARHQLNDPTIYYYFEYLYNEMEKQQKN